MGLLERFREAVAIGGLGRGTYSLQRFQATGDVRYLDEALKFLNKAVARCPAGSKSRPACLTAYGIALRERYSRTGDRGDQDRMIGAWEQALRLTPLDSSERPGALSNVGLGLMERYAQTGTVADLEQAITSEEEALKALPEQSAARTDVLNVLGTAFRIRYGRTGDVDDLNKAKEAHEDAVQRTPATHPNLHVYLNNLGDDLRASYNRTGNLDDLDSAVESYAKALQLCPPGAQIRTMYLSNHGTALRLRHLATGKDADLEQAIENLTQAVQQSPESAPNLPTYLINLGVGLLARFSRKGSVADLEQAVQVDELAVKLTPPGAPEGPGRQSSLALALSQRFAYGGNLADLDRAIRLHEDALKKIPKGGPDSLFCLNNLGVAFFSRFNSSGDLADLQKAIDTYEVAKEQLAPKSPTYSACLANLGAALRVRYERLNDVQDVQLAIEAYNSAVEHLPPESPEMPAFLNDLANGWKIRYQSTKDLTDLNAVIGLSAAAVQKSSHELPNYSVCCSTLGSALRERYHKTNDPVDLDTAIATQATALAEAQAGSPQNTVLLNGLANGLSDRYDRSGNSEDLAQAIAFYEGACQEGLRTDVAAALMAANNWGNWALKRQAWEESARAYDFGLEALDRLFRTQLLRASKESWLREADNLAASAAYALAQAGQIRRAVEVLEHGHARLLSQSLERDRAELDMLRTVAPETYAQYVAAASKLHSLETADLSGHSGLSMWLPADPAATGTAPRSSLPHGQVLTDLIGQSRTDVDEAVKAIRQVAGYQDFLVPSGFEQLRQSAQHGPLIYFAVSRVGGLALIVRPANTEQANDAQAAGGIDKVPLPLLTEPALRNQLLKDDDQTQSGYLDSYVRWRIDSHASAGWEAALKETTHWLWEVAMGPIVKVLATQGTSRATLIPQGLLGLLPLHAAWAESAESPTGCSYALDTLALSYAPNARALAACEAIAAKTPAASLLAVGNPQPITLAESLPNAEAETRAAAATFPSAAVFNGETATRQAILDAIQLRDVQQSTASGSPYAVKPANVWHFSCHGQARFAQPLESGLLLARDEWLTVRDLFTLQLRGVRLAILSACETGISGIHLPDELIGLPTALVQAGVGGVVASLWSVNEISTLLLLVRFYAFWKGQSMPADQALQQAQIWLRDTLNEEKADYFKMSLPEFIVGNSPGGSADTLPVDVAEALFQDMALRPLGERDFSHPYHWAAFGLTGV